MQKSVGLFAILIMLSGAVLGQESTRQPNYEPPIEPQIDIETGELLLEEPFDESDAWEQYTNPMGTEIGVADGVYKAYTSLGGFIWGLNAALHTDVVIEADIAQLSPFPDSAFGLMCRADPSNNGDGYYFIINGGGYFSIRIGEGDNVLPLVDWALSDAIETGININRLRIVCVEDYLALYVNDVLVVDVFDSTYTEGYAGLAIGAVQNTGADVQFDNLLIYEAQRAG